MPERIFFTGAPGSKWSGICQILESMPSMNISDRNAYKEYNHPAYQGHRGAYFGFKWRDMEWEAKLDKDYLDSAWSKKEGTKIIKSHDWCYMLDDIKEQYSNDWILLVYRPEHDCYAWWFEVGGFNITYPNYQSYKSNANMMASIIEQNAMMLEWTNKHGYSWHPYTKKWIKDNFGYQVDFDESLYTHNLVCLVKGT